MPVTTSTVFTKHARRSYGMNSSTIKEIGIRTQKLSQANHYGLRWSCEHGEQFECRIRANQNGVLDHRCTPSAATTTTSWVAKLQRPKVDFAATYCHS
jgi:hypothetical protein